MCAPAAVIAAISTVASTMMSNRQQRTTPQITRNPIPTQKTVRQGSQGLDPDKIKKDDEELTVGSTTKQQRDRKRAREGLKTLRAVDPPQGQLPSAPPQGITT